MHLIDYFWHIPIIALRLSYQTKYPNCMKINYLTQGIVKKNYFCFLLGHRFVETKKVNAHFSEFECTTCKMQVTNDSGNKKIALTSELKDINETLFYINLKKQFISKFYFRKKD